MLRILGDEGIGILTVETGCGVECLLNALVGLWHIDLELHHLAAINKHLHFHLCSGRNLMLDVVACDNEISYMLIEIGR